MTVRLREARHARGWSQARLVYEIARRLTATGSLSATMASLKVYVSEWENGHRKVPAEYRAVLRSIFGMTDDELFADDEHQAVALEAEYAELARRIEAARSVDLSMVDVLAQQSELMRSLDRKLGASRLVDQIESQSNHPDRCPGALRPARRAPTGRGCPVRYRNAGGLAGA